MGAGTVGLMDRERLLDSIRESTRSFDVIVIGGGATGAGIALDAASRGLSVVLLERSDFGAGTSSRSTKIIHGGVRYLAQAHFGLIRESLRERALLLRNAPHVVRPLGFVIPADNHLEQAKYFAGLKLYDWLAGSARIEKSTWLDQTAVLGAAPGLAKRGIRGGIKYMDAQCDDTRLLISIVKTAAQLGASVLNYSEVTGIDKASNGRIRGVAFVDRESARTFEIAGRVVINATGPYSDAVLRMDYPGSAPGIIPSQGAHLVVAAKFLPGNNALLMPRTPDNRIMFAIPWHGHALLGTTDTALSETTIDPVPEEQEVEMILEVSRRYLAQAPARADVLSCFAGIRPLAREPGNSVSSKISREHQINASRSGLVTISGGKWTTYRHMAEQCVDFAIQTAGLAAPDSRTRNLALHGATTQTQTRLEHYGTDAAAIMALAEDQPKLARQLHPMLPYIAAECIWAVRSEMARTVEDVLARRMRALFLNAEAAHAMVPAVAALMKTELKRNRAWEKSQIKDCEEAVLKYQLG
jgi:glycerol-3-phosphate dehydrogenase